MFTIAAWSASVAANAALTNVTPALGESHIRVVGNYLYVPSWAPNVGGAYACGVTPVQAQLRSPSIRNIFNQNIVPMGGAVAPGSPQFILDRFSNPIPLVAAEPIEALIMAGAGAQVNTIIAWFCDGPIAPVKGDIRTILATGSAAGVAHTWTNTILTFQDTLPSGQYQLVGIQAYSTTMQAVRALIPGQFGRPGTLGMQAQTDIPYVNFIDGGLGVWGTFMHDNPPTLDVLCNAADAANTMFFYLDVIYIGRGT